MGEFCLENLHLRRGICSNVRQLYKDIEEDVRFPAGLRCACEYMIIGAGWCLYFFLWAFYKIYYYLFKGIAVGCKKLYQLIKGKTAAPSEASVEPPKE